MRKHSVISASLFWLVAISTSSPALSDSHERGEALFDLCAQCHGSAGEGNQLFLAPAIAGLNPWYVEKQLHKFQSGVRGAHPDDVGGLRMMPMSRTLTDPNTDIPAVSAFVASLPAAKPEPTLEGGNASRGAALYAPCVACHGVAGEGMQALNGPPLRNQSDWYLLTQLKNFKAGTRGGSPQDMTGIMMRPMAIGLDDQGMKDVVAHIMTLAK